FISFFYHTQLKPATSLDRDDEQSERQQHHKLIILLSSTHNVTITITTERYRKITIEFKLNYTKRTFAVQD
ncbi:unnamed protein product, partial [Rotaria socialis]